jgi:type I restriction enzyme, S subunit
VSSLPSGWCLTTIGAIAQIETGSTPPKKHPEYFSGEIPFFKPGDLEQGRELRTAEESVTLAGANVGRSLPPNSVLVSCIGKLGKVGIIRRAAICNQQINALLPTPAATPEFLYLWARTIRDWLEAHASATTVTIINKSRFAVAPLMLPPLSEQHRIVAKVNSLLAKTDRARDELGHIPRLVERYRQAILTAAFRGDLTAEWRDSQRQVASGLNDLAEFDLDGAERGTWSRYVLPESWRWVSFAEMFSDETDSRRKLQQKHYQAEGRWPVVDQGEVFIGGYTDNERLVHPSEPPIVLFGDHTHCVKYIDFHFVQGADGTKVLKPLPNMLPTYAYFALRALAVPNKGYSRHMKFLRASFFPLCSLEEQMEVVRALKSAFEWLNRLSSEHDGAIWLFGRLDQSILAKAFKGELVSQDDNDEPASVLLGRISAERAKGPKRKGRAEQERDHSIKKTQQ